MKHQNFNLYERVVKTLSNKTDSVLFYFLFLSKLPYMFSFELKSLLSS